MKIKCGVRTDTVSATCPILPSIHSLHARSLETDPSTFHGLAQRRDKIEVTEDGIYVVDEFGINISYDCIESDYKCLIDELVSVGSWFIKKYECLIDTDEVEVRPSIDRDFLLVELL